MADELATQPVHMDSDERYPVYSLVTNPYGTITVNVPSDTIREWQRIQREYDAMQEQMAACWARYWETHPRRVPPRLGDAR